jgi:hypothetical protein
MLEKWQKIWLKLVKNLESEFFLILIFQFCGVDQVGIIQKYI